MRRFVTLVVLLLFAIPFGVSISGCSKTVAPTFCNGGDSGIATGQATNILLTPLVYGVSLNYAEIGQISPPTTTDCKGSTVFVRGYTYGHHKYADRGRSAEHRPHLRWHLEPQLRRWHSGLHLLHCYQHHRDGIHLRKYGRGDQQSVAGLRASGGHEHRAGRSLAELYQRSDYSMLPAGDDRPGHGSAISTHIVRVAGPDRATGCPGVCGGPVHWRDDPGQQSDHLGTERYGPGGGPNRELCRIPIWNHHRRNQRNVSLYRYCFDERHGNEYDSHPDQQHQLPGGASAVQCAGRRIAHPGVSRCEHRPERRGHCGAAGIGADLCEPGECGEFGGNLLYVSAGVDHANSGGCDGKSGGGEREQPAILDGHRHEPK